MVVVFYCIDEEGDQVFNESKIPDLRRVIHDKGSDIETESEDKLYLTESSIVLAHVPIEASALSRR